MRAYWFLRRSFFFSFLVFFLSFSCIFSCSQVRARKNDSAQLGREDSLKAVASLLIVHWSLWCPCHVNWLLYVTIKKRKLKYKRNQFLNVQQKEGDIFHDQSSFVLWTVFFSFLFFLFFFNGGTTGIGEENCASLHVSKNRDHFQVSWTGTLRQVSRNQKGDQRLCNLKKKKKGSSRRIYSCFFTHNGIITPKTTREGQESTTKTSLHLAWPPKFKNQVLFTPRAQSRFLDLGLLLRGCRPKCRSLPGRVEVIQPVVRACTTFWLTSTRITLTRVGSALPNNRAFGHGWFGIFWLCQQQVTAFPWQKTMMLCFSQEKVHQKIKTGAETSGARGPGK